MMLPYIEAVARDLRMVWGCRSGVVVRLPSCLPAYGESWGPLVVMGRQ